LAVSWSFVGGGTPQADRKKSVGRQGAAPVRNADESPPPDQGPLVEAAQPVVPDVPFSPSRMDGPAWSPARRARRTRLAEASRDLADLYEVAIDLVGNTDAPARMLLLGHCMREIGNRLPDILNPDLPGRSKQDEAVRSLAVTWRAAGLSLGGADQDDDGPSIPLPRQIVASIESVVQAFESGETANYAKASFLVLGGVPDDLMDAVRNPDPAVSALLRTRRYFMRHTHAGVEDHSAADEAELQGCLSHFEHVLDVRLGDWWEARLSIQDILAKANARVAAPARPGEENDLLSQDTGAKDV